MANTNGTMTLDARVVKRTFVGACSRKTSPVKIKSGQVLKAKTWLETDADGKAIAHSGMNEKALVTMPTKIDNTETMILAGLTFTSSATTTPQADLVIAWSGLTVGMTAAQANAANPVTTGSFTSGTLAGYNTYKSSTANSVLFVSTTPNTGVTDLAQTGTGDAATIAVTSVNAPQKPIAGLLAMDVDASGGDTDVSMFIEGTLWDECIVWGNNPEVDTIELSDLTTKAVTDYQTGASTDALKRKFLEGSNFTVVIPKAGEL